MYLSKAECLQIIKDEENTVTDYITKLVNGQNSHSYAKTTGFPKDSIILSSTYNVNGLEFAGVILVGVDDGRVPKTNNVGDVSENYIKYIAFNQLYLSASRAKYRLDILGNEMHGTSPCLKYSIENQCLKITQ